jgi:DNA repair protein RadC
MKRNPETLALAMDYAAAMEACAAYVAVTQPSIRTPEDAYRFIRPVMTAATGGDSQESFFVILLSTKNKPIGIPHECARGLLDSCPVHPAMCFGKRLSKARQRDPHARPSQRRPDPSKEELDITRRLIEAAKILGIRIVDHVICGRPSPETPGYVSLREKNLVAFDCRTGGHMRPPSFFSTCRGAERAAGTDSPRVRLITVRQAETREHKQRSPPTRGPLPSDEQ